MAIARVQYAKGGATASAASIATAAFGASLTAGNSMIVFIRWAQGTTISSIVDSLGNAYTFGAAYTGTDPRLAVYYCQSVLAGANVVTANFAAGTTYRWIAAIEYSGTDGGLDLVGVQNVAVAATDLVSTSFSTEIAGEVVVMAGAAGALGTYTAGTDFTLIDGELGDGGANDYGGIEEYITTGGLAGYTAHITSSVSAIYTTAWIAFKPPLVGIPIAWLTA